jgi:hypothetical protein
MIPELPIGTELDCELKIRAIRQHGLENPERLLNLTVDLVRQVYTLEHATLTALARVAELQTSLALSQRKGGPAPIDQRFYEMAAELTQTLELDMP